MNQRKLVVVFGAILVIVAVLVVGGLAYVYATGGSGQASAPISAPALVANTDSQQNFQIDSTNSKVQFMLTEDLMGSANTVVGTTNQVAGAILFDVNSPSNTKIGTIRIDARTLATDSDMRDRTTRSQILQSSQDKYEYIDFAPTAITGLPDKVVAGQSYTFKVTGDLTVHGVTKSETFDITAKLVSSQLQGTATTTVSRADFNLNIPNIPSVANVSDAVKLEIDFVAPQASAATPSATAQ